MISPFAREKPHKIAVFNHPGKMLRVGEHRVEARVALSEAVELLLTILAHKRSEYAIPDNKDSSVIAVAGWAVVHPVVRGGVEYVLQGSEIPDDCSVEPELAQSIQSSV